MRIQDWGGKPNWSTMTFDPTTKLFSLEPPKGMSGGLHSGS